MSTERAILLITQADRLLAEARTLDDIKDIRDKAQAAQVYAKKAGLSKSIIVHASAIKVQAERRLGQILSTLPLATSSPGNQHTGKLDRLHDTTGPLRLHDLGITKSDSSRVQQIAALPAVTFNGCVKDSVKAGQEPTTAGLLRLAKQHRVNGTVIPKSKLPPGFYGDLQQLIATGQRFATIYADPPWQYDNQGTRAATSNHYPTMTVEQIAAEPVAKLAADNCHLQPTQATEGTRLPAPVFLARAYLQVSDHIARPSLSFGRSLNNTVFERPERLRPFGPATTQPNHHARRSDSL